ncbi:MAG: ATP-dependent sacrificial sulfur transferase LarE [Thermoplasmatota archaeon]
MSSGVASRIRRELASTGGVLVAFSGGVDSAVVARLARDALGERAVAVTVSSQTFTPAELREARELAKAIGIRHIVVEHDELADEGFRRNPPHRCYLCRRSLARRLSALARSMGIAKVVDGANLSDLDEHRPGIRAATEAGVLHPLIEHGVTKAGVRRMARALGLPVHNRPSSACLSSRIPYGEEITEQKLRMVELAERYLRRVGFRQVRVRAHELRPPGRGRGSARTRGSGPLMARIEVDPDELHLLLRAGTTRRVARKLRELGFLFVTADLEGYRSGSLDELLFLK